MESAILMEWHVQVGDVVKKGQVIGEVETSKGVIEIEVFENGVITELLVEEESDCAVGTPLAIISNESATQEEVIQEKPQKEEAPIEPTPPQSVVQEEQPKPPKVEEPKEVSTIKPSDRIQISPAAKKRVQELGIDIATLAKEDGSPIQLQDIPTTKDNVEKPTKQEQVTSKEKPKDPMRNAIAKAMSLSNREIPHYYLNTTINVTPALKFLEELNAQRDISKRILPATLLIRACVKALQAVPQLNGFWVENEHQISPTINPGVAIALRKKGLITPALLDAGSLSLDETMEQFGDLIKRARGGKLKGSELSQQTITISNLGDLGVDEVYGVIYPPQVAVIGLGRISDAPWVIGDGLTVRKVLKATIAGDHRATDGRTGALFLDKLDKLLQNPKELL